MPIDVRCPNCNLPYQLADSLRGKKARCKRCQQVFVIDSRPTAAQEEPLLAEVADAGGEPLDVQAADEPPVQTRVRPRAARAAADDLPEAVPAETPKRRARADGTTPYWVHPDSTDRLVSISEGVLYVADLDGEPLRKAKKALDRGEPALTVLEGAKAAVPLDCITKVQSNLHHTFIDITWKEGGALSESHDLNIHCADDDSRHEIIDVLQERLGPGWRRDEVEYTRLRAMLAPLGFIAFFAFLTFCFYKALTSPSEGSGGKVVRTNIIGAIFVWVANLLGPVGVIVLGSVFIIGGCVWLVMRLQKPPIMLTLKPGPAGRKKKRRR
jgi:hypothetical protein